MSDAPSANMYVADTHALIWHFSRDAKLSDEAKRRFVMADNGDAVILISTMTLIEIIYLEEKGRVSKSLLSEFLNPMKSSKDGSYQVTPIDHSLSLAVSNVPRSLIPEMADRVITATAYHLNLPLITKDHRIHEWEGVVTIW